MKSLFPTLSAARLNRAIWSGAAILVLTSVARAATASSADTDWQSLQALSQTTPSSYNPSTSTAPDERVTRATFDIGRMHRASLEARQFYTKYPTDARAAIARRTEIVTAIQSVQLGGTEFKDDAQAAAAAFRSDIRNPIDDRFAVALGMESAWPSGPGGTLSGILDPKVADRLHDEFGDAAGVYQLYSEIIKTAAPSVASAVATEILQFPNAPGWAKAHAQGVVERSNLIGHLPQLSLANIAGKLLTLGDLTGRNTVIYFWDRYIGARQIAVLSEYKSKIPPNIRWIYVALGNTGLSIDDAKKIIPFAGEFCSEPRNLPGPIARAFKVPQAPFACILGPSGKLLASGTVDQIPTLFQSLGAQ